MCSFTLETEEGHASFARHFSSTRILWATRWVHICLLRNQIQARVGLRVSISTRPQVDALFLTSMG